MFKRVFFSLIAICFSFAAFAADAYKAPQLVPAIFDWSGLNLGLDIGWARQPMDTTGVVSAKVSPGGFFGCGHIGYDHQFPDRIVAGVVADACGGDVGGKTSFGGVTIPAKADLFGTVRAKLGYALNTAYPILPYITGGLAWSKNNVTITGLGTAQDTQLGWAAGLGAEMALSQHWVAGVEWIYSGYGHGNYAFATGFTLPLNVNSNQVRASLGYKF